MLTEGTALTREEANAKIAQLRNQINDIWSEIEDLCEEHNLVVSRPDSDGYSEYYVTSKEQLANHLGYDPEDMADWINWENRLPDWVGSAELE